MAMKIIRYLFGILILLVIGFGLCFLPATIQAFAPEAATLHPVSQGSFYFVFAVSFLLQLFCGVAVIRSLVHGNDRRWSRGLLYAPIGCIFSIGFLWPIPLIGEGAGMATGVALWPITLLIPIVLAFLVVILVEEKLKQRRQRPSLG